MLVRLVPAWGRRGGRIYAPRRDLAQRLSEENGDAATHSVWRIIDSRDKKIRFGREACVATGTHAPSVQIWSDQVRSDQVRPGQIRADQVRAGRCATFGMTLGSLWADVWTTLESIWDEFGITLG